MEFKAFKMDGLGNDFVIIDERDNKINLINEQIKKICDRKFIGCDQLIIIRKADQNDAELIFYNSDGSKSGACGNGTRCVASLLSKENNKKEISVWTLSGNLKSKILNNNEIETEIGIPKLSWNEIPLTHDVDTRDLKIKLVSKDKKEFFGGIAVNVGNPDVIMHTNSTYPCPPEDLNLRYIEHLKNKYSDKEIGYSGHEYGLVTTFAGVAMGATWIERHITMDRESWGSDQKASIEPSGLFKLVKGIRDIEKATKYEPGPRKQFEGENLKKETLRK